MPKPRRRFILNVLAKIILLLSVSLWVGSVTFFSAVAAPAIFRTLPRHQAGDVVGAIFPTYYWIGHICGAVALASLLLAVGRGDGWTVRAAAAGLLLVVMLAANLYAGFVVQSQVSQVKTEIRAAATEPDAAPPPALKASFDRLHALSVKLNVVVLVGGLLVLVIFAVGLKL